MEQQSLGSSERKLVFSCLLEVVRRKLCRSTLISSTLCPAPSHHIWLFLAKKNCHHITIGDLTDCPFSPQTKCCPSRSRISPGASNHSHIISQLQVKFDFWLCIMTWNSRRPVPRGSPSSGGSPSPSSPPPSPSPVPRLVSHGSISWWGAIVSFLYLLDWTRSLWGNKPTSPYLSPTTSPPQNRSPAPGRVWPLDPLRSQRVS